MSGREFAPWETAITDTVGEIRIRGYLLDELVEQSDFVSVIALILRGELATPAEARMLNAIFVAICDHGIVPSSSVARIVASCGVPIQSAIAAAISTIGDDHGGACEELGRVLQEAVRGGSIAIDSAARVIVEDYRSRKARVPGYGHGHHPEGDPRATQLLAMAERLSLCGDHTRLAQAIDVEIERQLGRRIPINTDGAIAGIASDMGIDYGFMRPLIIISRSVGLAAHAWEQTHSGQGWRLAAREEDIKYNGPPPRSIPATREQA
jgi:citrate synthase